MITKTQQLLRYSLWWAGIAVLVLCMGLLLGLTGRMLPQYNHHCYGALCRMIGGWTRLCLHLHTPPVHEDLKLQGPYIITANHQSLCDTPVIIAFLSAYGIYPKFLLKKSLKKIPSFRTYARRLGFIWVDRSHPRSTARAIQEAAHNRTPLEHWFLFPEGTRAPIGHLTQPKVAGMFWLYTHFKEHQWLDLSLVYQHNSVDVFITAKTYALPDTSDALHRALEHVWQEKARHGLIYNV